MTALHSLFCTELLKSSLCLHIRHMLLSICHNSSAQQPHVTDGHHIEECSLEEELLSDKKMGTVNEETYT